MISQNRKELERAIHGIILTFLVLLCLCVGVGVGVGKTSSRMYFEKQAVDRGYAIYNPTNGVFQWK